MKNNFYSEESETIMLAAILKDPNNYHEFQLTAEDFYIPEYQVLYQTMKVLCEKDQLSINNLTQRLRDKGNINKVGGSEAVNNLAFAYFAKGEIPFHLANIREKSAYRKVNEISKRLYEISNDDFNSVEDLVKAYSETVSSFDVVQDDTLSTVKDALEQKIISLQSGKPKESPRTGFKKLDEWMNGLGRNRLIVIAGRPGTGKTAFSLSIFSNIAKQSFGIPIYFSMEMDRTELTERMLADYSGVSFSKIQREDIEHELMPLILLGKERLEKMDMLIDDKAKMDIHFISSRVRKLKREHKQLGIVIIDYLGLMDKNKRKEETTSEAIGKITMGLKQLAREISCSIVLLCQMNRSVEQGAKRKPTLSDLRDSGNIEQDADMVMFLHRESEPTENSVMTEIGLYIEKGRQTGMGSFKFMFNGALQRFAEE